MTSSNAATALAFARFAVGIVLLAAAIAKAQSPGSLSRTVHGLGVPRWASTATAWIVIACETSAGVYLLSGYRVLAADVGVVALTLALAGGSGWAIASRRVVPCSCFGVETKPLGLQTLALSGSLAIAVSISGLGSHVTLTGARLLAGWAIAGLAVTFVRSALIAPALIRIWLQRRHLRGLFTQTQGKEA